MISLRRHLLFLFSILSLLFLPYSTLGEEQRRTEPVKLRVVLMPYLSFAPILIAEEEGYFAEQGLQIEFVQMNRSAAAVPALAQGELDVLPGTISLSFLNAIARGARIKFVADKGYVAPTGCTHFALVARRALVEGGELNSPARLKGRRISAYRASSSEYYVDKVLKTAGLMPNDIEFVDVPSAVALEALKKGSIDLATSGELSLALLLQTEQIVLWLPAQQVIPDFQYALILYGPTLLDQNPDAGRRFMVAYLKAVRQYNRGRTERNVQILTRRAKLDQELLRQTCWPPIRGDGRINVNSVLDFQAWAIEKKFLDKNISVDQFWDPSFVEHANQVLSTPPQ